MSPLAAMKRAILQNVILQSAIRKSANRKDIKASHAFFLLLLPVIALTATAQHAATKKDLFASDPSSSTAAPAQEMIAPSDSDATEAEEPAISATDAALRAQRHTDGKVMNVRQFQDEDKTLYGVKLLQKNGRIKTINIDANSGSIVE